MEVFFSYAHKDEALRDELAKHLKLLERQGVITAWHDRNITAGEEWKETINNHLESANIILLLISADFLASDYCYDIELKRALERQASKEARVIPIILRPVNWQRSLFGKLEALPKGGKAITSWHNEDEAFTDVVRELCRVIGKLQDTSPSPFIASVWRASISYKPIALLLLVIVFFWSIYKDSVMKPIEVLIKDKNYEECLVKLDQSFLLSLISLSSKELCTRGLIEQANKIFKDNNNHDEAFRLLNVVPKDFLSHQVEESRKEIVNLKGYREAKEAEGKCDWSTVRKALEKTTNHSSEQQNLLDKAISKNNTGEASVEEKECPSKAIITKVE
jgi:TIR domain